MKQNNKRFQKNKKTKRNKKKSNETQGRESKQKSAK